MKTMLTTARTALADSWANRASFGLQLSIMFLNDVTWIIFWGLFFHRVGTANGWTLSDVLLLFAMVTVTAGISLGIFANCRRIGRIAAEGGLDETLVLPIAPLRFLLLKRIEPSNIGDICFGMALLFAGVHPSPAQLAVFLFGVAMGTVVMTGFLVIIGSLSLLGGGTGEQADLGLQGVLLFAMYPIDFFGGPVRLALYVLVPTAFITGIPVNLVRHFSLLPAISLVVAAGVAATLAVTAFHLGLRRYSSGAVWMR